LQRLAELPPGWHAVDNLAWEAGGDDLDARRVVRRTAEDLWKLGYLDRMWAYVHARPQAMYLIDNRLADLAAGEVAS
jgi:hypothetical protein